MVDPQTVLNSFCKKKYFPVTWLNWCTREVVELLQRSLVTSLYSLNLVRDVVSCIVRLALNNQIYRIKACTDHSNIKYKYIISQSLDKA